MLYRIETGKRPFKDYSSGHAGGNEAAYRFSVMTTVSQFKPMPPSELNPQVSRELEAIIMKTLEKDPARRYQSAQHILRDLRRIGYVPEYFNPERRHEQRRSGAAAAVTYRLRGRGGLVRGKGSMCDCNARYVAFLTTTRNPPRTDDVVTLTVGRDTFRVRVTKVQPTGAGYHVVVKLLES